MKILLQCVVLCALVLNSCAEAKKTKEAVELTKHIQKVIKSSKIVLIRYYRYPDDTVNRKLSSKEIGFMINTIKIKSISEEDKYMVQEESLTPVFIITGKDGSERKFGVTSNYSLQVPFLHRDKLELTDHSKAKLQKWLQELKE